MPNGILRTAVVSGIISIIVADVPEFISITLQSHKQVELIKLAGSSVAYVFDHSRMNLSM